MSTMRSISPWARDQTLKLGKCPRRFIGSAERNELKPECISPQIERQWVRAGLVAGNKPAVGYNSLRYSVMARVSHTLISPWFRQGTRIEGDSSRISARAAASAGGMAMVSNSMPLNLATSQPRSDHDE